MELTKRKDKDKSRQKEGEDAAKSRLDLFNKVVSKAKSKDIVIGMDHESPSSYYASDGYVKSEYKDFEKKVKANPEKYGPSVDEALRRKQGGTEILDALKKGKGRIGVHTEDKGIPSSVAHELGHAIDQTEGGVGSKIRNSIDIMDKRSLPTSAVTGLLSGINSERLARKGKKEGLIPKHSSWAVPVLMNTPTLINEAVASRKGYKVLKEVEATGGGKNRTRKADL